MSECSSILDGINCALRDRFHITHTTIQFETTGCETTHGCSAPPELEAWGHGHHMGMTIMAMPTRATAGLEQGCVEGDLGGFEEPGDGAADLGVVGEFGELCLVDAGDLGLGGQVNLGDGGLLAVQVEGEECGGVDGVGGARRL